MTFTINSECKACKGTGKVLQWSEAARPLQNGDPWVRADCPSCLAHHAFYKREAEKRRLDEERRLDRPNRAVMLARGVLEGPRPPQRVSDLEGRCSECDRRSCICDVSSHYAWELAELVLELSHEGRIK